MIETRKFILSPDNKDAVMPNLGQYLRALDIQTPIEVLVREHKSKRSSQQNRRMHKIIGMCAKEAGYTIEEMKLTFKAELLEPLELIKVKGFRVPIYKSTAAMNTHELNDFMEGIERLAAQWYQVTLAAADYH